MRVETIKRLGVLPKEALVRRERLLMAKQFLGGVLLPLIAKREPLDYKRIQALANEYKGKYQGQDGSDFELPHVWFAARRYLISATYAAENTKTVPPELDLAQRAYDLLTEAEKARIDDLLG